MPEPDDSREQANGDNRPATVSSERRREILAELRESGVPIESDLQAEDLMVKAYLEFGGVPSRMVPAAEGAHTVPDLTATQQGRAALSRLSGTRDVFPLDG